MQKELIAKVEALWAREMIKELTYAYGRCIERQDAEGSADLDDLPPMP